MDLSDRDRQRVEVANVTFTPEREINTTLPTVLYFLFKILGLLAPLLPITLGYHLFIMGVTGEASIVVDAKEIKGQLVNAAPGLFFAVGGIAALIIAVLKGVKFRA